MRRPDDTVWLSPPVASRRYPRIRNRPRRCSTRRLLSVRLSPAARLPAPGAVHRCHCRPHRHVARMALPTPTPIASPETDRALVARLRAGEGSAFDAIFAAWYAPLVRFAARIVGDSARAEEAVQDTMLALWRGRATLDPEVSPQAWLFHATRNRALNVVRHDGIASRAEPKLTIALQLSADDRRTDADRALAEAELNTEIDAAVAALPPRCREVFVLSRIHGVRQAQIAARLGISTKTVEAHMTHALRVLRHTLSPWLPPDAPSSR